MQNLKLLFAALLFMAWISSGSAVNPGLKVRVSQPGLNYVASVGVQILAEKVRGIVLHDMYGKEDFTVGKVEYWLTNMKVTGFQSPSTSVTVNPGRGLTWTLSNAAISLHGDWRYKARIGPIPVRDSGTFDASSAGISISVSVSLGANATTGEPTISESGCQCNVNQLDIKVHGGASWLYNFLMRFAERPIRNDIGVKVCEAAKTAISVNANKELATLAVKVIIKDDWLLDYRLVAAPAFAAGYLESFHKAEFFYKTDPAEAPFQPLPLPSPPTADRMLTFWVSEYVINTAGYVLHKHGALKGEFTKKDLPPAIKDYLDTSCPVTCIGTIVPAVGKAFPNATVEIEATILSPPSLNIDAQKVLGNAALLASLRARLANNSLVHLFDMSVAAKLTIVPSLQGNVLRASVGAMDEALTVVNSSIGPVDINFLRILVDIAKKFVVMQKLNETLGRGFPLPTVQHVEFVNPTLQLQANCLGVSTDLKYKPGAVAEYDDDDAEFGYYEAGRSNRVLHFEPPSPNKFA